MTVLLHLGDEEAAGLLERGCKSAFVPVVLIDGLERTLPLPVVLRERTRLLIRGGRNDPTLEIVASPNTELRFATNLQRLTRGRARRAPSPTSSTCVQVAVISDLSGVTEIPLPLGGARFAPMAFSPRGTGPPRPASDSTSNSRALEPPRRFRAVWGGAATHGDRVRLRAELDVGPTRRTSSRPFS